MAGSPRRRYPMAAARERLRRHPGPVLDFAVGRHRETPPETIHRALREEGELLLSPATPDEIDAFAQAAADMLGRTYGLHLPPGAILPAPGGRTAMSFLAASVIRRGDGVLLTDPAFPAFARAADQYHAEVHVLPLEPDRGFEPDLDVLSSDAAASIRFTALNYPNNPTGTVITREVLGDFLRRIPAGTIVFNDATYGPLTYEGPPWSLLAAAGETEGRQRLVELHSLAKIFALGPLSVAFLVGEERFMDDLREYSEFAWSHLSSLQARVACRCLQDREQIDRVREVYRHRLARLHAVLERLGFEPFPVASGMHVVCRAPVRVGDRSVRGAPEAADLLLSEYGIAVVPWEVPPHGYLRFTALYLEEELEALGGTGCGGKIVSC